MLPPWAEVLSQVLRARLLIDHAKVIDRLQLSKVAYKNDRDVPEGVLVRVLARLAEVTTLALLESEMHAREECAADE